MTSTIQTQNDPAALARRPGQVPHTQAKDMTMNKVVNTTPGANAATGKMLNLDLEDALINARRMASIYISALERVIGDQPGPRAVHLSKDDVDNIIHGAVTIEKLICVADEAWRASE